MRRLPYILLGLLLAAAGSAIATGSTPPGLPWVVATKQAKIRTNPASSAAADASLLLDSASAGSGECMIGVDTATDVCLIDAEGDAAAASMAVVGTSSAATISATTALTLEETGAGTDAITLQAPASITAPYTLELPPDAGGAGECLQNTGTPGVLDFGACAAGAGDITAVGSMTSGAAFADATATGDCLGLTNDCSGATVAGRIEFDDQATDEVNILNARVGIGISSNIDQTLHILTPDAYGGEKIEVANSTDGGAQLIFSAGSEPIYGQGSLIQLNTALHSTEANYFMLLNRTNGPLTLGTNGAYRMFVAYGGNVGIGTDTTPDTLLDVQGTLSAGTNGEMSVDASGNITTSGNAAVNGGDLTTTAATMNLIPSAATAINIGTTTSADINIGDSSSTVDFGDTASAATAFLPDADAGADLGTSAKHFRAAYFNQEFTGPVHRCTADANCTVATTDRYVFMNEQASQRYVILPAANISGQTISIMTGNNSGAVTVTVCTQQDANCGSTGTDVIDSSNTTTFGTPTNTQRTSIGNGRRYISDGAGVWIELPTL